MVCAAWLPEKEKPLWVTCSGFLLGAVCGLLREIMPHTGIIIAIVDEVCRVVHIAQLPKPDINEVDGGPDLDPW
jgi:hypothetical protein